MKRRASVRMVGPVVMACQRGKDFGMREVLEIGMVLANESFAESRGHQYAGWEIVVFVEGKTVTNEERVGGERGEKIRVVELGLFPFGDGAG